jgi:hypothetical protein
VEAVSTSELVTETVGELSVTLTEVSDWAATEIVIVAGLLCWATPLKVAFTKTPTLPAVSAAVKVVALPDAGLRLPSAVLVKLHEYVIPDGQVSEHVGVAVRLWVSPPVNPARTGVMATDVRVTVEELMVMGTPELITVRPSKEALTNRVTEPTEDPAVNVTWFPLDEFSSPKPDPVSAHR